MTDETLEKSGLNGMIEKHEADKEKLKLLVNAMCVRTKHHDTIDKLDAKIEEDKKIKAWLEARRDNHHNTYGELKMIRKILEGEKRG